MSTPPALGFYLNPTPEAPSSVTEQRWRGVSWSGDGSPEGFGASLLRGLGDARGDLERFLDNWVKSVKPGDETYPLLILSDDESAIGNTCYCYVMDVGARRLDVFGTYVGANGVLLGSIFIDAMGRLEPPSFEHLQRPRAWRPEDDEPTRHDWPARIESFVERACRTVGLDVLRTRTALVRASALEARVDDDWHIGKSSHLARIPSLFSFWRAADEHGLDREQLIEVLDQVGSDILHELAPDRRFLLAHDDPSDADPKIYPYVLDTEVSREQRSLARTTPVVRSRVTSPIITRDWTTPFLVWAAQAEGRPAPAPRAEPESPPPPADVSAAIERVCGAHALTASRLIEDFGALLEELLLLESWQSTAGPGSIEPPEQWPESWNPLVIGGSGGAAREVGLAHIVLRFPRAEQRHWPRPVVFRPDGSRATVRLTPRALATHGPRRLGDSQTVLTDLFAAVGSAVEGRPIRIDARGVVLAQRAEDWEPLLGSWVWWLSFFEWAAWVRRQ